ncbi:hypothetical protein ACHAWF_009669 [Thalassiosira exigua]
MMAPPAPPPSSTDTGRARARNVAGASGARSPASPALRNGSVAAAATTTTSDGTPGKTRKRMGGRGRRLLRPRCLAAALLAIYLPYLYFVASKFGGGSGDIEEKARYLRPRGRGPDGGGRGVGSGGVKPPVDDFCGLCRWRDQSFNCNERVEWVVRTKEKSVAEAKASELRYCTNANGCKDKIDEEGFMYCEEQKEEDVAARKEPNLDDFCGLCQWRDQPFNCNERMGWVVKQKKLSTEEAKKSNLRYCVHSDGCKNDKVNEDGFLDCEDYASGTGARPPGYTTGTQEHVMKEPELEAILSGQMLLDLAKRDRSELLKAAGERHKPGEEGLRDRRTGEDVAASVLIAARDGDRKYDDKEGGGSNNAQSIQKPKEGGRAPGMPVLTAYCEPLNQTSWETRPLPVRDGPAVKDLLFPVEYPRVNSCASLPAQWPVDSPPVDLDPYLPWIHDVFPTSDGREVVFVAQNRRRCYNGQRRLQSGEKPPRGVEAHKGYIHIDYQKNYFHRPQSALFQHVPVRRTNPGAGADEEPRYRLASHEEADPDGIETRFICRFKSYDLASSKLSVVGYSLSRHEFDYDYHTYRKGYKHSATEAGFDNHMIWQSQLLFRCPVPSAYHDRVRRGEVVANDYATLYVDVVPVRTAPRYTPPREFLQPRYEFHGDPEGLFDPDVEWGKEHLLPRIDESGRWENVPVCLPSLMAHGLVPRGEDVSSARTIEPNDGDEQYKSFIPGPLPPKIHKVVACTWASTTFRTRSNRARVGDGKRRLREWLEFNLLAGFSHIYVYDNSGAFTDEDSLADVVDLFPTERVTRVDWPCRICSNRDGNEGERSSQYAAESSCRLRFGTHARWLGSFDTDEYLVPMGKFDGMGEVADELDRKGAKVAVFKSSPAKPRFGLLENPSVTTQGDGSFTPTVPDDETFLHAYNCNWEQFPRKNDLSHRRKQMYRADNIKLHYHYSTVTVVSQMTEKETKSAGESWLHRYVERHVHEFDEMEEATMLHTKTKVARNMLNWRSRCRSTTPSEVNCHVGFPFPKDKADRVAAGEPVSKFQSVGKEGYGHNCFINQKIESYWWPKLVEAVKRRKESALN